MFKNGDILQINRDLPSKTIENLQVGGINLQSRFLVLDGKTPIEGYSRKVIKVRELKTGETRNMHITLFESCFFHNLQKILE